ncbi:MAG: hypothetical protein WA060_03550 [Minisyncoccia bacterium]
MSDKINKEIINILKRLDRLETFVFPKGKKKVVTPASSSINFTGTKGGVLFLVSKNYFSKKHTAREVLEELAKNDYHYKISVVQTTLNRLSDKKGFLTALEESGQKVYVKRK